MSKPEDNERIVNSAIDATNVEQPQQDQQEQQQPTTKTVTVPEAQYQALITANLNSHLNTLNTLDELDKIIASMTNVQIFVMNIKEKIKTNQLGLNQQQNQQNQQLPEKTNAQ